MNWLLAAVTQAANWLLSNAPAISDFNVWVEFIQNLFSAGSNLLILAGGAQENCQQLQNELGRLKQCMESLPEFISQAEWFVHREDVAPLLQGLKGRLLDARDLLDEFNYSWEHKVKMRLKGFDCQYVKEIREDMEFMEQRLEKLIDRRAVVKRFDKWVRPDMNYVCDESQFRGRDSDIKVLLGKLGVVVQEQLHNNGVPPQNNVAQPQDNVACSSTGRKRCSVAGDPSGTNKKMKIATTTPTNNLTDVSVCPIVGIGGIGKTTLAQKIFSDEEVHRHFDLRIWISVSNDFDVVRLTKELVQRILEHELRSDHLSNLQGFLTGGIQTKKFLLVLDDVWDDVYMGHENKWQTFLKPLRYALPGSMVLLTTRSQEVAKVVKNKNDDIKLEGLLDDDFRDLFNDCAFGIDRSGYDQELENIGATILPHLKGCPLAAKTVGRLLSCMLTRDCWNDIARSELWRLDQKNDDILPVLRLSYQYLLYYQRNCFSYCAMYPKGYLFDKDTLVEQWIAAGLLDFLKGKPEIYGHVCWDIFIKRSLFQKDDTTSRYFMHDLIHDMAQLVSGDECFIIKSQVDLGKIPQSVRNLSILEGSGLDPTNWRSLSRCKKLRSLVCHAIPSDIITPAAECWFKELTNIRILSFISCNLDHLPENIGNLKLLRYLNISECTFQSLPRSFWSLSSLHTVNAQNCMFHDIPEDFNRLGSLQKFKLRNTLVTGPGYVP